MIYLLFLVEIVFSKVLICVINPSFLSENSNNNSVKRMNGKLYVSIYKKELILDLFYDIIGIV